MTDYPSESQINDWNIHNDHVDNADELIDYEEMAQETCVHKFVSWHGTRAECQECGKYLSPEEIDWRNQIGH